MKYLYTTEKLNLLIIYLILSISFSFFIAILSLSSGVIEIPTSDIISLFFLNSIDNDIYTSIILDIRLPRILLSFFVGLALSISGAVMQGLFRNPLADPSILGVSARAATDSYTHQTQPTIYSV